MRSRHWSNSKLADFIRGTVQLKCGTAEEWRDWEQTAKTKHPFRYWLTETALDKLQDFIMYPIDKLYSIKYWFNNRFITKTHTLTSNLKKGEWHEFDERILHCLFDSLVDWVEIELAWKNIICDEEAAKIYDAPWYSKGWWRFRVWRSPAAGLDHLDWETTLTKDEDWGVEKDNPEYGKTTDQAIKAQEISELYHWWKYTRPNRPDPYDVSGWTEYCEEKRNKGNNFWDFMSENETEEEKQQSRKKIDLLNKIEEEYYQEDQNMLIRLIKIRRSLWT
jgi:hypothetical protein